jgi:hypothetical protein
MLPLRFAPCSLDYPGIGPEHSFLKDVGRAEYHAVTDEEALDGFQRLSQLEGIIPALETSHAIAYLEVGHQQWLFWGGGTFATCVAWCRTGLHMLVLLLTHHAH